MNKAFIGFLIGVLWVVLYCFLALFNLRVLAIIILFLAILVFFAKEMQNIHPLFGDWKEISLILSCGLVGGQSYTLPFIIVNR
jgi:hypothetical protein